MSQWHVELTSKDTILLTFLTTCLQEPSCTVLQKSSERFYVLDRDGQRLYRSSDLPEARKDTYYYWLSSDFDHYTDPQDVLMHAQQQVPLLNSILRLKFGVRISSLNVNDVYRPDEQDRLMKETMLFPPLIGRRVTSESLLQTINAQHPSIAELWQAEHKYPAVEEAMQHFANQWNWFNLYKAYEVIKKETRRLENSGKMKRGTFDTTWTGGRWLDFEESANKERHSSLGYQPRQNATFAYMSLNEATAFVTHLFFQWLQTK
jgi:hypothetical protein